MYESKVDNVSHMMVCNYVTCVGWMGKNYFTFKVSSVSKCNNRDAYPLMGKTMELGL
jgi:hypothetical protein